jgi:UDP-glucose 4-epimerase
VHKTRILVTGATGFIGSHVARLLAQTGRMPRLMFRRPHRAALIAPLDAELVCADIDSRQSLRRAVAGVDAVIHLAARATFERYAALKPTVVDGTRALAEAAAEAGVRTFVFGSSTFVHGNHAEPITSDTPTDPAIDYGVAKCEAERALQEVAEKTAMQLGVLRLPHVYGPESLLFTYAREGRVLFAGAFDQVFSHLTWPTPPAHWSGQRRAPGPASPPSRTGSRYHGELSSRCWQRTSQSSAFYAFQPR